MMSKYLVKQIPTRRISPFDGLQITAEVWEEAHNYHRIHQQLHYILSHGAGILSGLFVLPDNPPSNYIHVGAGIAVDSKGQLIVHPVQTAYDIGNNTTGTIYLLLTYSESKPEFDDSQVYDEGDPLFIESRFSVAAHLSLPKQSNNQAYIELARIKRSKKSGPITLPKNPLNPGLDELDLRFRQFIGPQPTQKVGVAIYYANGTKSKDKKHTQGLNFLARACNRTQSYNVWVDDQISLEDDLTAYSLIYLVADGEFKLPSLTPLYNYIKNGGTLLVESNRRNRSGSKAADESFKQMFETLGFKPQPLPAEHSLLTEPYVFATPPPGFESQGSVQIHDGIIFSTYDYGSLWLGQQAKQLPTRTDIKIGMEWGTNILNYAFKRQRHHGSTKENVKI